MNLRMIMIAGVCFVLSAGAGTFWSIRSAPAAQPHVEGEAADSLHLKEAGTVAHGDSAQVAVEHVEAPQRDSIAPVKHDSAQVAQDTSHSAVASAVAADSAAAAKPDSVVVLPANATSTERLARIFGAMRPEEAARLLESLPDVEVRSVLLALSDRKAAAILANFKGERANALARALVVSGGGD